MKTRVTHKISCYGVKCWANFHRGGFDAGGINKWHNMLLPWAYMWHQVWRLFNPNARLFKVLETYV